MFAVNWPFVVRILTHVGRSASPPSGSYAADGTNAISIATDGGAFSVFGIGLDGDGDVDELGLADRRHGRVWYVYLCGRMRSSVRRAQNSHPFENE